jgi:hypothetical protein
MMYSSRHPFVRGPWRPFLCDLLRVCPEGDTVLAGDITGAKLAFVPATEGLFLTRHWHTDVNASHARFT